MIKTSTWDKSVARKALNKTDADYQQNHHDRLASTTCTNFNLTVSHNVQLDPAGKVAKKSLRPGSNVEQ